MKVPGAPTGKPRFRLLDKASDHYVIAGHDGASFKLPFSMLKDEHHKRIQHFAKGGVAEEDDATDTDFSEVPQTPAFDYLNEGAKAAKETERLARGDGVLRPDKAIAGFLNGIGTGGDQGAIGGDEGTSAERLARGDIYDWTKPVGQEWTVGDPAQVTPEPAALPVVEEAKPPPLDTSMNLGTANVPPPVDTRTSINGGEDSGLAVRTPEGQGPTVVDANGTSTAANLLNDAYAKQEAAIAMQAAASQRAADEQQRALDRVAQIQQQAVADGHRFMQQREEGQKRLMANYAETRLDPARAWKRMDQSQAIFGMVLGGIGAGLAHTPNWAAEAIGQNIKHDLDSQMADLGTKKNLLSTYMAETGDLMAAQQMLTAHRLAEMQADLAITASYQKNADAQAKAQAMLGELDVHRVTANQKAAEAAMKAKYGPALKQAEIDQKMAATNLSLMKMQLAPLEAGSRMRTAQSTQALNYEKIKSLHDKAAKGELPSWYVSADRTPMGGVQLSPEQAAKLPSAKLIRLPDGSYTLSKEASGASVRKIFDAAEKLEGVLARFDQFEKAYAGDMTGPRVVNPWGTAHGQAESLVSDAVALVGKLDNLGAIRAFDIPLFYSRVGNPGSWTQDRVKEINRQLQEAIHESRESTLQNWTDAMPMGMEHGAATTFAPRRAGQ